MSDFTSYFAKYFKLINCINRIKFLAFHGPSTSLSLVATTPDGDPVFRKPLI